MCGIRCIIAGCRDFSDYSLLRDTANQIFRNRDIRNLTIISGHCSAPIGWVSYSHPVTTCHV